MKHLTKKTKAELIVLVEQGQGTIAALEAELKREKTRVRSLQRQVVPAPKAQPAPASDPDPKLLAEIKQLRAIIDSTPEEDIKAAREYRKRLEAARKKNV